MKSEQFDSDIYFGICYWQLKCRFAGMCLLLAVIEETQAFLVLSFTLLEIGRTSACLEEETAL